MDIQDLEETKNPEGYFKVCKVSLIDDLAEGAILPESDLLVKNNTRIVQFEYVDVIEKKEKIIAKPGAYNMIHKGNSLALGDLELRDKNLLTSYDNTSRIFEEAKTFFDNLHRYDEIGEAEKKRAILLYSPPGYGKTSAITRTIQEFMKEDPNTIAINWPTSEIRSSEANRFLSRIDYAHNNCSRLILVIEDIGGGEQEDYHGRERGIDSSLLNLLDGVDKVFPIPTFIIATTNHPGSLLDALADRPGRFDEYIEIDPPSHSQRVELVEFISKRKCTEEEVDALKKAVDFSPAHLSEVVKRSFLKNKTYSEVIEDLLHHKNKVSKRFEKNKASKIGLGLGH